MDNQTEEDWLESISDFDLGTGIFIIPEGLFLKLLLPSILTTFIPTIGKFEEKKLISDLTYEDSIRIASKRRAIVFKWIPYKIASYETIKNQVDACDGKLCVKRCAKFGCICFDGVCR